MFRSVLFPICIVVSALSFYGCERSCKPSYDAKQTSLLIQDVSQKDSLTSDDFELVFMQLESMLEYSCDKAQALIDSGYRRELVRIRLRNDVEFKNICCQADTLDSIALRCIEKNAVGKLYEDRYRKIVLRYSSKMEKVGLL